MLKILIMGLPGSGKTTLAQKLTNQLEELGYHVNWYNADCLRQMFNDWDFSEEGRIRQARRMGEHSNCDKRSGIISICDFVCPTTSCRKAFAKGGDPDFIIWMNTTEISQYSDTNLIFEQPKTYTHCIKKKNADYYSRKLVKEIVQKLDS